MASIDVVVPCYQYGHFLRDCVGSILTQDVADLRVLIIDNASTDCSVEVAQELARLDRRVELISHTTNCGASASYNEGIDWATADYFHLLDADDVLAPGCLARAIDCMESNRNVHMTYGAELRLVFEAGRIPVFPASTGKPEWTITPGLDFLRRVCASAINHVGATTVVRRTAAQKEVGHYRSEIPYTDDLELWLRLATVGDVAETPVIQAARRQHGKQATNFYSDFPVRDIAEREAAFNCFFRHEGNVLADVDKLRGLALRRLSGQAYWSGLSHLFRGQRAIGWALLNYSVSKRPISAVLPPVSHLFLMQKPLTRLLEVAVETATGRQSERMSRTPVAKDLRRTE